MQAFASGLDNRIGPDELCDFFERGHCDVDFVYINTNENFESKGTAFIHFMDMMSLDKAVTEGDGMILYNKAIQIDLVSIDGNTNDCFIECGDLVMHPAFSMIIFKLIMIF